MRGTRSGFAHRVGSAAVLSGLAGSASAPTRGSLEAVIGHAAFQVASAGS